MKYRIIILFLSLALVISLFIISLYRYFINEFSREVDTRNLFEQELSRTEGLVLEKEPWGDKGELLVWSTITGKGKAIFWYTKDGKVSDLMQIGNHQPDFGCYDNSGNLLYTSSLNLGTNHKFKDKFPFEINTMQDIVDRYDEIVTILDQLPPPPAIALSYTSTYTSPHLFDNTYKNAPVTCNLVLSVSPHSL